MKKITVFIIIKVIFINLIVAQLIQFDFNTDPYINVSIVDANITVSDIALSDNKTIETNVTTDNEFIDRPYISESTGWTATTSADAKYFYIDITALTGQQFSITDISFEAFATAAGPSAYGVLLNNEEVYSANMPNQILETVNQPIIGYNDLSSITIKIAGWDNDSRTTSGGGAFRIDYLTITGTSNTIPPKDSTSSVTLLPTSVPQTISSLNNTANGLKVLDIILTDSASGDGVNTFIDEVVFTSGTNNQITNWDKVIDGALLTGNGLGTGVNANIITNSLSFNTTGLIEITEGIANQESYALNLWLNDTLNEIDNKQFEFYTDSLLITSNTNGSHINHGKVSSGINNLKVDVNASKITATISNKIIRTDSIFNILAYATDANGNIDFDYSESATLSAVSNTGILNSTSSLTSNFVNGTVQFSNLTFNATDTVVLNIETASIANYHSEAIIIGKHIFKDDFELNSLDQWSNTADWTSSDNEAIDGSYSLKHNLSDTSASSFIAAEYIKPSFNNGKTIWQLLLKNGNFDPTSSNKFWYYLMASTDSLTQEGIYGYAVGVNFKNSTDSLSLWRIDSNGDKTLILQAALDWDADTLIAIEVSRDVPGIWKLGFGDSRDFKNITYTESATDKYYESSDNHGLVFNYTTTRAGLLKADNFNFFQINTAPILTSVEATSRTQVALTFSETISQAEAEILNNYTISSLSDVSVTLASVEYNANKPNQVFININTLNTASYIITASGLKDEDGALMKKQSIEFSYQVPAKAFDIVISEILCDPTPSVGLPKYDYIEIYNRSANPFYLNDWVIEIGGVKKTLPDSVINVNEYLIITSSAAIDEFKTIGKTIGIISSTALTNNGKYVKLISNTGVQIDSIYYSQLWYKNEDKEDGGWSLEKIDLDNTCSTFSNWTASENTIGGTPGSHNSVNSSNLDNEAPVINSIKTLSNNQVLISFNDIIDKSNLDNLNSFAINKGINNPDSIKYVQDNLEIIHLYFKNAFQSGNTYSLTCSFIADECNNTLTDTTIFFTYYQAQPNDIVINEIMADASPAIGLPEVKYLELYNQSNYTINLTDWKLWYGAYFKLFPEFELESYSYLILCPSGYGENLTQFGKTLDILSSTTLPTTGKHLQLKDTAGTIISQVYYNKNWYQNPDKEDGGWSLEKIDPTNNCSGKANWKASENEQGGTPGQINSVIGTNVDSIAATLTYFRLLNASELTIEFSEEIDTASLVKENFIIENKTIENIEILNTENSEIKLTFSPELTFEESYILSIDNLADLCSNISTTISIEFTYNLIEQNDIVITELMVDPVPVVGLPEFEYIEITNLSHKTIQLENWKISINESEKTLPKKELAPNEIIVLCSELAYSELIEFGNSLAVKSFPSLPNESGLIQLLDTANNTINIVQYSSNWYNNEDKDNGGWSLERIDPNNQCSHGENWKVAENILGGTPGQVNSVNGVFIDNTLPKVKSLAPISDKEIWIEFTETISHESIGQTINYNLEGLDQSYIVYVDSNTFSSVVLLLQNTLVIHRPYTLNIKNLSDNCHNILQDTTLTFAYTEVGIYEIVINEIMASPSPAAGLPEAEYIELYNNSGHDQHLYKWSISIGNSTRNLPYTFFPNDNYLLICKSEYKNALETYGQVVAIDNLPALPNNSYINLSNNKKQTICLTDYSSNWITDDFKEEGGYSLERIDYNNFSENESNWQVTLDENGGTPGAVNSIYRSNPDTEPFHLTKAVPYSKNIVLATFNKPVSPNYLSKNIFSIDNEIGIATKLNAVPPFYNAILLQFGNSFTDNVNYTFEVDASFTDLAGKTIENNTDIFMLAKPAQENSTIINEVLFNPNDNGVDFIELYNKTNYAVNLSQLFIATRNNDRTIKTPNQISWDGEIILPSEYKVVSTNSKKIKGQYYIENEFAFVDATKMISLSNGEGTIVIIDTNGIVIDEFTYNENMHFGLLDNTKGISLERINHERPTQESGNWHSAAEQAGWATPGYKNSVHMEISEYTEPITIEPKAFSPDNDGYNDVTNFHYNFNKPGNVANVTIFNTNGQTIRKLVNNELLAQTGVFVWDGLSDNENKAQVGIYIVLFEIFDAEGNVKNYKKTCVVATKI